MDYKSKCVEILKSHTVASLPTPHKVTEFNNHTPLFEAFQTLLRENVLSAPVRNNETGEYVGFLDIRDLVAFVVFIYDEQKVQNDTRLADIVQHGSGMLRSPGTDGVTISYLSRRHRFNPVPKTQSLFEVAQVLSANDVHRVPVVENGKVVNVISQSSIVGFLSQQLGPLIDSHDASVGSLNVGSGPVLTVNQNETVINTFRKMEQYKRSGIALTDGTGKLVGTTTGKDIGMFLKSPHLAILQRTIFQHLQLVRSEMNDIRTPCISVFITDPLSRAVGLLAATRVHRVFVVTSEQEYNPTKVISISDILRYLTN